jgi:peptidoglycan/LPS O-acetylase OafA/YrhL
VAREVGHRPRWGLRTLGFLALAALAVLTYDTLRENGVPLIGFIGLTVGLVGATVCSVQGLRNSSWFGSRN